MILIGKRVEEEDAALLRERYALSMERIRQIPEEAGKNEKLQAYFSRTARFLEMMDQLGDFLDQKEKEASLGELAEWNQKIYEEVAGDAYETSYANPAHAVAELGEDGKLFCALYAQVRQIIDALYERKAEEVVITLELFLEVYHLVQEEASIQEIRQAIYWFHSDYSELFAGNMVREMVGTEDTFYRDIIESWKEGDERYLYRYGLYVSDTERKMARFLDTLSQEEIRAAAQTFAEGYIRGFQNAGKSLEGKDRFQMRYSVGCERLIREGIHIMEEKGFRPILKRNTIQSTCPNRQYLYDHRFDKAIYLDRKYKERRLKAIQQAFEQYKAEAAAYAGPILVETFGQEPFAPKAREEAWKLSEKQQKIQLEWNQALDQIMQEYVKTETTSFSMIAFPTPQIGPDFEAIFRDTVKVNTLDNDEYGKIQQTLIDALDQGEFVKISGTAGNETELMVALHQLKNPQKETNFENCLADVNIPLGEVFTSPKLKGTNGVLHVSRVFLHGMEYRNLKLTLKDGMIADYTCSNFENPEQNKRFLEENLLFHHETLPLGEFAIGTNTTAYRMAVQYDIFDRLTILIAEKTGPHFAMGDTCYSQSEDIPVYNPDGKEIVARENEWSALRRTDPQKAYFFCHTDITIPYEELGSICVIRRDGSQIPLISGGRFVLPGTEKLNEALEGLTEK